MAKKVHYTMDLSNDDKLGFKPKFYSNRNIFPGAFVLHTNGKYSNDGFSNCKILAVYKFQEPECEYKYIEMNCDVESLSIESVLCEKTIDTKKPEEAFNMFHKEADLLIKRTKKERENYKNKNYN